ncbi:MAG: NADPH-dependent quinone reductase ArsH [Planctomycetes bacterium]|nr:NADPH-dependent quinone reductase ArsH [Planctomycetota bacterium]
MAVQVLGVCGSTREGSRTKILVETALAAAVESGAEARVLDLREVQLPIFETRREDVWELPPVKKVVELAEWADAFILGTPEYHGGISGALKNWLDYLYDELSGKLAGVVSASGGGGGITSILATKQSFAYCHGFNLPFHAGARGGDFEGGKLASEKVRDRLQRIGHDIVRYAPVLRKAFNDAKVLGAENPRSGFAGFHA